MIMPTRKRRKILPCGQSPSGACCSTGRAVSVMASAAVVIQPVTSLTADIPSGQCWATRIAMPTYCAARKPRLQRQSRYISRPADVTVTMATATQAMIRSNKLRSPLYDHDHKQHQEKKRPHQTGLALEHVRYSEADASEPSIEPKQ